jgi:hypothetical protein
MSIHHKFVALFNATPGAYDQPVYNNTTLLLDFVTPVTQKNIDEDQNFVSHVLGNMAFDRDIDGELYETAESAMLQLVVDIGRAGSVDTAIDFLINKSDQINDPFFAPAHRFKLKVEGSTLASRANEDEGDPDVLTAVFSVVENSAAHYMPENRGTLSSDGRTLTYADGTFLDLQVPINANSVLLSSDYETVPVTGSQSFENLNTINAAGLDFRNSIAITGIDFNLSESANLNAYELFQNEASFTDATLNFNGTGDLSVGRALSDAGSLASRFWVSFLDSTVTGSPTESDIRVAGYGNAFAHGHLEAVSTSFSALDRLIVGVLSDENIGTGKVSVGSIDFRDVEMTLSNDFRLGANEGRASATIVDSEIQVGRNISIGDEGGTATMAISQASTLDIEADLRVGSSWIEHQGSSQGDGTLRVVNSTVRVGDDLNIGTNDGVGRVVLEEASLQIGDTLQIGADWDFLTDRSRGSLHATDSTIVMTGATDLGPFIGVGSDGGAGSVTLDRSVLSFIQTGLKTSSSGKPGQFYSPVEIGRGDSSVLGPTEDEGVFILTNGATFNLENAATGNTNLFLAVGRGADSRGSMEVTSGSTVRLSNANPDVHEVVLKLGSRGSELGYVRVDGVGSSIELDSVGTEIEVSIGSGTGSRGEINITNGGQIVMSPTNAGFVRVGDYAGSSGSLEISGPGSAFIGAQNTVMTIGERPESQYNADTIYEADLGASDFAGATGNVVLASGAQLQIGVAGDGIPDIFVGTGGSLIALDGASVIGDIRIVGTGSVSPNLEAFLI